MIDQDRIEIKKFSPEDLLRLLGSGPETAANARLNLVTGPAITVHLDKELAACGGIRIKGVAEAWAQYSKKALGDINFLHESQKQIDRMCREHSIWRLWSEVSVDDDKHKSFLKHMGFTETQAWFRLL